MQLVIRNILRYINIKLYTIRTSTKCCFKVFLYNLSIQNTTNIVRLFFSNKIIIKFMPEVVLAYDYTGLAECTLFKKLKEENEFITPLEYMIDDTQTGSIVLNDVRQFISLRKIKTSNKVAKFFRFEFEEPHLDVKVFNRIDGNHRLHALELINGDDFQIPFCIILLSSSGKEELRDREKTEMEIFHNINSKAKPLTETEQYRGLFNLFSVAELEVYGKEFSITQAYMVKYKNVHFVNMECFFLEQEDIVLSCIKFFLDRKIEISEDEIVDIFSNLEHTYFSEYSVICSCKNRLALIPYVFYCYEGNKQKNSKLTSYNTWFMKNKLYNVKDFEPTSMIEVFNSIYEMRSKRIFVAMPFKPELDFVFDSICNAVKKINSENDVQLLEPIRIDKQIVGFSYDIVNEILANIQNAGLLIADLTEQNANVYYEAGYAQGLLKAKCGDTAEILYLISNPQNPDEPFCNAKFDVQHYKIIPYKNVGNGGLELQANIEKELRAFYCI